MAWSAAVIRGGFAFDDSWAIFKNPVVTGELPASEAFQRDYWHHVSDAGQYRPAATLSLRFDYAIYGERAYGYHLTNLLLHTLVVGLLALALYRLRGAGPGAFLGLCVFAVHPVLADSVAWISGRTSMLSAIGGLLALVAVVYVRRPPLVLVGTTLALLLGMLAKEDAIVFALPLLLLAWARSRRLAVACAVSLAAACGVYLLLRAGALGSALPSALHAPLAEASLFDRLAFAGRSLLEGFRLLLFPFEYPPNYRAAVGFHPGAAPAAWAWLGWMAWDALALGGLWALVRGIRRERTRSTLVGVSAVLAALSFLPVMQIVPAGEVFAPRFLYLPLLLGAPAIGIGLRRLPALVPALLIALFVIGAWVRAGVYADRESYSRAVLEHVPHDAGAYNDLGIALEEKGHRDGARTAWVEATRVRPGYSKPWSNLGRVALEDGELDFAEYYLGEAVRRGPKNAAARVNYGSVLFRIEKYEEAAKAYLEATRLSPGLAPAWYGLGRALQRTGDEDGAREALRRALKRNPGYAGARSLLDAMGPEGE